MRLRCALNYISLVSETIPCHKDYHVLCAKERSFYKKVSDFPVICMLSQGSVDEVLDKFASCHGVAEIVRRARRAGGFKAESAPSAR